LQIFPTPLSHLAPLEFLVFRVKVTHKETGVIEISGSEDRVIVYQPVTDGRTDSQTVRRTDLS